MLEDVLNLVEQLSTEKKKAIVVFDEFQEVQQIDGNLSSLLYTTTGIYGMGDPVSAGSAPG